VALSKAAPKVGFIFENYFKDAYWLAAPPRFGFIRVLKVKVITDPSSQSRGGSYNRGEAAAVKKTI
jgi:hypothetical protein